MGCQIIFSSQALADLEVAVRYIAKENPDAALRVGNRLIDKVALLENFPLIGSRYAKRPGIRFLVSHPYIIFYRYRAKENCADILRYWHGARGQPDL